MLFKHYFLLSVTMNTIIFNYDNKLKVVISNLLSKADSVSKLVLTAFDSSKDVTDNVATLSGPRFKADVLSTCAKLFNIALVNSESADCDSECSISFTLSSDPALKCFLCLQGCHDCISPSPVDPIHKGAVWLCKLC